MSETNVDEELLARLENGVLWLTINRAEKGNAIPWYVRDRLIEHFRDAQVNLDVRAIVLTATGDRHFCTGADLSVPQPAREKPDGAPDRVVGTAVEMMRRGFQTLMQVVQDCEKPVIAADTAKIIQVFVRRGLVPDGGVAYLLPRIVGMHKAKELVFFGDDLSAADAESLGIVNRVVPAAELQATAKEWAERLASGPTKAIGWAKKLLQDASELSRRDLLNEEGMLVELNGFTQDSGEGVASFRERRTPEWKGW